MKAHLSRGRGWSTALPSPGDLVLAWCLLSGDCQAYGFSVVPGTSLPVSCVHAASTSYSFYYFLEREKIKEKDGA